MHKIAIAISRPLFSSKIFDFMIVQYKSKYNEIIYEPDCTQARHRYYY